MNSSSVPKVIHVLLCLTTLLISIISLTGDSWMISVEEPKTEGLWRFCDNFVCLKHANIPSFLKTTRVLATVSTSIIGIGTIVGIAEFFYKRITVYYASIIFFIAITFLSATQYVYSHGKDWTTEQMECGTHYFLCWFATVLCALCSFYGFCSF